MITVNDISVQFGGTTLFSNVSFAINENDKIALMGKNGAGKSTLLKIIAGASKPSSGNISAPKDAVIAYLPQHLLAKDNATVFEETSKAFAEVFEMTADFELSEVIRNQGNIQKVCNYIRQNFSKTKYNFDKMELDPEDNSVVLIDSQEYFIDTIKLAFEKYTDVHVLTWTNQRTNDLNNIIRKTLFGSLAKKKKFCENEQLIATGYFKPLIHYKNPEMKKTFNNDVKFYTSDKIIIKEIIESSHKYINSELKISEILKVDKMYLRNDEGISIYIYKIEDSEANFMRIQRIGLQNIGKIKMKTLKQKPKKLGLNSTLLKISLILQFLIIIPQLLIKHKDLRINMYL